MQVRIWLWLVAGLLVVAGLYGGYVLRPMLFPDVSVAVPADPDCDLRAGPCVLPLPDGGRVSFAIAPREIPAIRPLVLEVELQGLKARAVEVDFRGVDMNMGFNRVKLEAEGEGRYVGRGMLPACVRTAMEWEAQVLVSTRQGLVSAAYRFITVKPGTPLPGPKKQIAQ